MKSSGVTHLWLLVDPVVCGGFPGLDLIWLEPEGNLLLGILDAVGTVADVAANIDGVVTTDGTWSRGERVGGTEKNSSSLDGITAFPDHGDNRTAQHVYQD